MPPPSERNARWAAVRGVGGYPDTTKPPPLITRLTHRLFGAPLLRYSIRGEWVEEMVAQALEPGWALCADDRSACDLR